VATVGHLGPALNRSSRPVSVELTGHRPPESPEIQQFEAGTGSALLPDSMSYPPRHRPVDYNRRANGARRTCLIVEGDPEMRRSLEALIRELDIAVLGVANALEALSVLEKCRVDLLMTEERLPGPSGTMLLRAVRYRWPHVARVLVGDRLKPDVLVRAVNECGVQRIVSKRMHPVTLRDEVGAALNEAWLAAPDCHSGSLTIPPFAASEPPSSGERDAAQHLAVPTLRRTAS
jgi:DNA-binding NarL/FixJ family response regulator